MSTLPLRLAADFGPHRGRMDGRGFGHPGLFVLGLLLLAAVITMAVLLIRGRRPHPAGHVPPMPPGAVPPSSPASTAEMILSERFARGEVSVEDFVTARAALRGEWTPSATSVATSPLPMPAAPPTDGSSTAS